ncbi:MAG: ribosome biogenesis GTP-binding protein YihA/YsxC [Terriglobia bacterium]
MTIVSAELVCTAADPCHFPKENLPEVAFVGRSNVGKSSLINSLTQKRKLAFTSSTPGRTQRIHFYRINHEFYFVDLPGYGYAKAPRQEKRLWAELIQDYLGGRDQLVSCVLAIDSRLGPTSLDLERLRWFQQNLLPFIIVSTKSDKLSKSELRKSLNHTQSLLPTSPLIAFSATSGEGREKVWQCLYPQIYRKTSRSSSTLPMNFSN